MSGLHILSWRSELAAEEKAELELTASMSCIVTTLELVNTGERRKPEVYLVVNSFTTANMNDNHRDDPAIVTFYPDCFKATP